MLELMVVAALLVGTLSILSLLTRKPKQRHRRLSAEETQHQEDVDVDADIEDFDHK